MTCHLLWLFEKIAAFVETGNEQVSLCVRQMDLPQPFLV